MKKLRCRDSTVLPLVLIAVLGLVGPAAARTAVKSNVTIVSGSGAEFAGKVGSAKKVCRSRRTVKLFRADGMTGAGTLVGTAKTNNVGAWTMDGNFLAGYYYARVQQRAVHLEKMVIHCAADVSVRRHF